MKASGSVLSSRRGKTDSIFACVAVLVLAVSMCLVVFSGARTAWAQEPAGTPSVLIIDAGLNDFELAGLHWLGEGADIVAEDAGRTLMTKSDPLWWTANVGTESPKESSGQADESASASTSEIASQVTNGASAPAGPAPATFLLGSASDRATTADDVAWALDKIRESGAEPRTFVVAMGATGLSLREYVEDLAGQKQSARADVVGMAFCGAPQNGYSVMEKYPEQTLWERIGQAAGWSADDLRPQSARLKSLNEGSFPRMTKSLSLAGVAGDLGFGQTDAAGVAVDFALSDSLSDQVESSRAPVTIARQLNLTGYWSPFTSSINYAGRNVDSQLTQQLSAFDSYELSNEVMVTVRDFYRAWFGESCPVTHNANVLLLDLSGSMVEPVDAGRSKLDAAKEAAGQYLQAMKKCSELPQAAPMSVSVFGFNETLGKVADGYDQASIDALGGMVAQNETNIGIALDQALDTLRGAPTCADKHVLLLSDGESTRGKSDEEMLNGTVAAAAAAGIVVDTIGFGNVGESDAGFLQQVANATGGTYYQADDTYSLKVNFLKSYYSSLGLSLVDEEVEGGGPASQEVGSVDERTSVLALGVVGSDAAPNVKLQCNGVELDAAQYAVEQASGLTTVQCVNPPVGKYSLEITDGVGAAHVFAVKQPGITHAVRIGGEQKDYSLYLLIGAGVLLVIALVVVVVRTMGKPRSS